jgi:hypothetical protein
MGNFIAFVCNATFVALRQRHRVELALAVVAVAAIVSCGGGGSSGGSGGNSGCTVSSVTVSGSPANMAAGATANLAATVNATAGCATTVSWSASPAGGTLIASGNSATFSAPTAGNYTVTATSTADATKSGSAVETVTAAVACSTPTPNGTVVTHSANVSASETWAGDGVTHLVPTGFQINGSALLTIQACAIVALGQGATLTVANSAKLLAAGTSATRQVFFIRADPNQPWGILRGFSETSMIELHWTQLLGGGAFSGQMNNPGIAAFGPGYAVAPAAVLKVDNVLIDGPQGVGVYLDANAAFTADSQNLQIRNAGDYVIRTTMMSLGSIPSGSYTGNLIDTILIFGPNANVFADMTIHDRGVPVRIPTGTMVIAPPTNGTTPVTLTIEPGVVLMFPKLPPNQPGARVIFGHNGNAPNNVAGILRAIGTPQKHIVFTSGEAVQAPGDWVGLWLDTATGSKLDNVEISYAGGDSLISSTNCRPANTFDNAALIVGDFSSQYIPPADLITNSLISNSAGFGIDAIWQSPGTDFSSPNLSATNSFIGNASCAQTFNGVSGVCPQHGCTAN